MAVRPEKLVQSVPPAEWLRRIEVSIEDTDLRLWVASVIYWDFADTHNEHEELFILSAYIQGYRFDHNLTERQLIDALLRIDYPMPDRRIKSKQIYEGPEDRIQSLDDDNDNINEQ